MALSRKSGCCGACDVSRGERQRPVRGNRRGNASHIIGPGGASHLPHQVRELVVLLSNYLLDAPDDVGARFPLLCSFASLRTRLRAGFAVVSGFCDLAIAAAIVRLDLDQLVRGIVGVADRAVGGTGAVGRHLAQSLP